MFVCGEDGLVFGFFFFPGEKNNKNSQKGRGTESKKEKKK
jgi:hypothetical protein